MSSYKEIVKSTDFDSYIYSPALSSDRRSYELMLILRIFLRPLNPPSGKNFYYASDWNDTPWPALRWNHAAWQHFQQEYVRQVYATWDTAFVLTPPADYSEFTYLKERRKILCRIRIDLWGDDKHVHGVIDVVRLATPQHNYFRSSTWTYSSKDLAARRIHDRKEGVSYLHRTISHEVGHLLGLNHINEYSDACQNASTPESSPCYGSNLAQSMNVMGRGSELDFSNADPWLKRITEHTYTRRSDWKVEWAGADMQIGDTLPGGLRGIVDGFDIDPDRRPAAKPAKPGMIDL